MGGTWRGFPCRDPGPDAAAGAPALLAPARGQEIGLGLRSVRPRFGPARGPRLRAGVRPDREQHLAGDDLGRPSERNEFLLHPGLARAPERLGVRARLEHHDAEPDAIVRLDAVVPAEARIS